MVTWVKLSWKGSRLIDSLLHHIGEVAQELVGRHSGFRGALEASAMEFGFEESVLLARVANSLELPFVQDVDDSKLLLSDYHDNLERFQSQSTFPYDSPEFGLVLLSYDPSLVCWLPSGYRVALVGVADFEACTELYQKWLAGRSDSRPSLLEVTSLPSSEAYPLTSISMEVAESSEPKYGLSEPDLIDVSSIAAAKPKTAARSSTIDVLALEDDRVFGGILGRFFEREGLKAEIVTTVAMLEGRLNDGVRPSVIVTDLHLEGESGFDILKLLPVPAPPVVMLTSDSEFEVEIEAIQRGVRAFLSKERDPRLLAAYVKAIVKESSEQGLSEGARVAA
jgi:ActR/RegA family two-component response regulator